MLAQARAESSGYLIPTNRAVSDSAAVLDSSNPGYYLRFLVQLRADRAAWRKFSGVYDKGLQGLLVAFREAKPYMPTAIVNQRYVSTVALVSYGSNR